MRMNAMPTYRKSSEQDVQDRLLLRRGQRPTCDNEFQVHIKSGGVSVEGILFQ